MAIIRYPPSDLPDIFYEEPEPVEDGLPKARPLNHIRWLLYGYYDDRPDVFGGGGYSYVMYNRANGNDRVDPDCYIAFDVDAERILKEMANFWVWDMGKVPDFALEMASPSTVADDLGPRRDLYERLGIAEYWRLDHTGGKLYGQPLIGERLVNVVYKPHLVLTKEDGAVTSYSELLGLAFYWREERGFDILDTEKNITIDKVEIERAARLAAEARLAKQARADASEARVRMLQDTLERLRRQQSGQ